MVKGSEKLNDDLILKIIKRIGILSIFIMGFSLILFKESKPIILGYIFGVLITILCFKLLDISIQKAVKLPPRRASAYATGQYFIRYIIYGLVLAVAAKADYLNLGSTALGLLSIKIVIVLSSIFKKSL